MVVVPFALSVHTFVHSVGADVGFASIIGVALLALLTFSQARETSSLRDRLDEAGNRIAMLEQRLMHLARAQPPTRGGTAQPPVAPPPAVVRPMGSAVASVRRIPTAAPAARVITGAPAGMAAPALNSATRMVATPTPAVATPAVATPAVATPAVATPATTPVPAAVPATAGGQIAAAVPAGVAVAGAAVAGVAGVAASAALAGAATTGAPDDTLLVAPATAAGGNGHGKTATLPPPARGPQQDVPPRVQIRPEGQPVGGPPRRPVGPVRPPAPRERSWVRKVAPAILGLALVAVVVVGLLLITNNGNTTKTAVNHPGSGTSRTGTGHRPAGFNPHHVTVSVLNGTAVTNLAKDVGGALSGLGYKQGTVANAASQTHTTTIVAYRPGYRGDALKVARSLKLSFGAVSPADQDAISGCSSSTTGAPATSCSANVIVTVGTDLAGLASSATSG